MHAAFAQVFLLQKNMIIDPALMEAFLGLLAGSYAGLVDAGREAVLRALSVAGCGYVRAAIVHETVTTPVMWQDR